MNQCATYRTDLYYVTVYFRSRTGRTTYGRDLIVPAWKYYLLYRWQLFRFRGSRSFHRLQQRDRWPRLYHDVPDPQPLPADPPDAPTGSSYAMWKRSLQ